MQRVEVTYTYIRIVWAALYTVLFLNSASSVTMCCLVMGATVGGECMRSCICLEYVCTHIHTYSIGTPYIPAYTSRARDLLSSESIHLPTCSREVVQSRYLLLTLDTGTYLVHVLTTYQRLLCVETVGYLGVYYLQRLG